MFWMEMQEWVCKLICVGGGALDAPQLGIILGNDSVAFICKNLLPK